MKYLTLITIIKSTKLCRTMKELRPPHGGPVRIKDGHNPKAGVYWKIFQ